MEHVRFERLNQVVTKAVEQTIKKSLMAEQLHGCFPTISEMDGGKEALETARKQIQKYFHSTCFKQFEHIFSERDLKNKLDELDEIIQDGRNARDDPTVAPLHVDQLSAESVIGAHLTQAKVDTEKKLAMIYEQLVVDNHELYEKLLELGSETQTLSDDISASVSTLAGEVDALKCQDYDAQVDILTRQVFGT